MSKPTQSCPFCGAERIAQYDGKGVQYGCGTAWRGKEPWQVDSCRLNVAEAEIERMKDSNMRLRDVIRNFRHAPIVHQTYEPAQAAEKEPT